MNRLIAPNSVPLSGADRAPGSGTPQYATSGVPGVTAATTFPAYAWNMLQEELMAILSAAGVTPNSSNWGQVLTALEDLFAPSAPVSQQMPAYAKLASLSTTTANNTSYNLTTQAVTLPALSRTGGFRLKMFAILEGGATAQMEQNFQLIVSDGTTTLGGTNWLVYTTAGGDGIGLESSFFFPTIYSAGATPTITLSVAAGGGGGFTGQLAMTGCSLYIQVEDA